MKKLCFLLTVFLVSSCSSKNVGQESYQVTGLINMILPIMKPSFKNDPVANNTLNSALEGNKRGETSSWRNNIWKMSGSFTPVSSYQRVNDKVYCRKFLMTWKLPSNLINQEKYTACRIDDNWVVQDEISYYWGDEVTE